MIEYKLIIDSIFPTQRTEKNIKKRFPDLWSYIIDLYCVDQVGEELTWSEKLYWFMNDLKVRPTCKTCGGPSKFISIEKGYRDYCSQKCCNSNETRIREIRRTNLERYGVENPSQVEEFKEKRKQTNLERYGVENYSKMNECREKVKRTNLERYGVENPFCNEGIKNKIKETNLERYGVKNPMKLQTFKDKLKQTNLERYGVENYSYTDEYKHKSYNTKKKNGTFNSSKIEQELRNWLDINNIEYKHQYRSEQYPFMCDFYFPDQDLYLEIQGSWTHGCHPYDPESLEDQDTLTLWTEKGSKYYNAAIETWAIRDPEKRRWVREHGLNWIEVFTCDLSSLISKVKEVLRIS